MRRSQDPELAPFDPEIERTFKFRRRIQEVIAQHTKMDEERLIQWEQERARWQAERIQLEREQARLREEVERQHAPRRIRDYIMPTAEGLHSSILLPEVDGDSFRIDSATLQMIRDNKFNGFPSEDPNAHLRTFKEISDNYKVRGVSKDNMRLRLFSFSVEGRAKDWLDSLPNNSITTWNQLVEKFLAKYFPPAKTEKMIRDIQNFQQGDYESLYEAYERFNDMLRKCPHHGLTQQQLIRRFYYGLTFPSMNQVDNAANGALLDQYPEEALRILESLTTNSYRAYERNAGQKQVAKADGDNPAYEKLAA